MLILVRGTVGEGGKGEGDIMLFIVSFVLGIYKGKVWRVMHDSFNNGDNSKMCIIRQFYYEIIRESIYTNLDGLVYYTPRLYGITYWF